MACIIEYFVPIMLPNSGGSIGVGLWGAEVSLDEDTHELPEDEDDTVTTITALSAVGDGETLQDGLDNHLFLTLHQACEAGDLDRVKALCARDDLDVEILDDEDWTPLFYAIKGGHMDIVLYLMEQHGAQVDHSDECLIAFHESIHEGHMHVLQHFEQHFNMQRTDSAHLQAIHYAALGGHMHIVKHLVERHGVSTAVRDSDGWTPLHYAALTGSMDTVRYLVEVQLNDIEAKECDGWVPLHCAANRGNTHVVKYLLEERHADRGALVANVQQTALHLAVSEGRLETTKYLVEKGFFDVMRVSSDGETSLHLPAMYGKLNVVKYLLERPMSHTELMQLLFAKTRKGLTAHQAAVLCLEEVLDSDSDDQDDDTQQLRNDLFCVEEYLYSYVAPLAVEDVKLNSKLKYFQYRVALQVLSLIKATTIHEVAHHILSYLCLADIK